MIGIDKGKEYRDIREKIKNTMILVKLKISHHGIKI